MKMFTKDYLKPEVKVINISYDIFVLSYDEYVRDFYDIADEDLEEIESYGSF